MSAVSHLHHHPPVGLFPVWFRPQTRSQSHTGVAPQHTVDAEESQCARSLVPSLSLEGRSTGDVSRRLGHASASKVDAMS